MQTTRTLSMIFVAAWLLLVGLALTKAAPIEFPKVAAPPLGEGKVSEKNDLGMWDDAVVVPGQDMIVLRKGEELFSLPMDAPSKPKKLLATPATDHTQITAVAQAEERLWLFLYSREAAPFALDVYSGDLAKFEIPGLAIPGKQTPGIQSHVIVPQSQAAILMVGGGDKATWPRDGNRPIYFWMDLKSGKVARLPTGWDLDYFSANQNVAVFAKPEEKAFERRPLQAVEMRTGALLAETPNRRKEHCVPFDWGDKESVKPLYGLRPETGDAWHFGGLSYLGQVLPLEFDLEKRIYLAMAKTSDGLVGFRLRHGGGSRGEPSPYWIAPFAEPEMRERVAANVTDFALLKRASGVFVTAGHGRKEQSSEAWFHGRDKSAWNVLEGIERLPPLDKQFADADYVHDKLAVQLVESVGKPEHDPLLVCLFTHRRGDMRALTPLSERKALATKTWRRAIALTSAGQRFEMPLFREEYAPEIVWLHHSGKLIFGNYTWHSVGDKRERQVQLSEIVLQVPRSQ